METPNNQLYERLELFRKKLLDTSRRNKLVNFRSRSRLGDKLLEGVVVVEGEEPTKVLDILISESPQYMTFVGLPDRNRTDELDLGEDDQQVIEINTPVDQDDNILSTRLTTTILERHLTKIRRNQVMMIEEQGINALFLSMGLLEWYEADHSQEKRVAPLVLVPVLLDRTERGGFKIKWDGTEVGANLSIAALLKEEFAIDLPLLDSDVINLRGYFTKVEEAICNQRNWRVDHSSIALSFFSFAKYLIYKDLSPSSWPEHRPILHHPLLDSLLVSGFAEHEGALQDDAFLDDHRPIGETNEVFDADGSQTLAILEALTGHSMVIEGPPGTGKSQTIANLIAEFIALGKRVLFVSEKSAALNVVYDRLKSAGLAGACLELHGTKANKRSFYEHLKETIGQAAPRLVDTEHQQRSLSSQRSKLNDYVHALHQPLDSPSTPPATYEGDGQWRLSDPGPARGVAPRQILGRLVRLGAEPDTEGRIASEPMYGWTDSVFRTTKELVESLRLQLIKIGLPQRHPFWGSGLDYISPDDKADLERTIGHTWNAFTEFRSAMDRLTTRLHLDIPESIADVSNLESAVDLVTSSPDCSGIDFFHTEWLSNSAALIEAIGEYDRSKELKGLFEEFVTSDGWSGDPNPIEALLVVPGDVHIPYDAAKVWSALDGAEQVISVEQVLVNEVSQILGVDIPRSLLDCGSLGALAMRVGMAPDCQGIAIDSEKWRTEYPSIVEAIACAQKSSEIRTANKNRILDSAWHSDITADLQVLDSGGHSWYRRLFSSEYRHSRTRAIHLTSIKKPDHGSLLSCLHAIREVREADATAAKHELVLKELFGERWLSDKSSFDDLSKCAIFLSRLHFDIYTGTVSRRILDVVSRRRIHEKLLEKGKVLERTTEQCVLAIELLDNAIDEVKPGYGQALTDDPTQWLYAFVLGQVREARISAGEFLTVDGKSLGWQRLIECMIAIEEFQVLSARLRQISPLIDACLGDQWRDRHDQSHDLMALANWVKGLVRRVHDGELPAGLIRFFQDQCPKGGLANELESVRTLRGAYAGLLDQVATKAALIGGSGVFLGETLDQQSSRLQGWVTYVNEIESFYRYNSLAKQCRKLGLNDLANLADTWPDAKDRLTSEFERSWCNLIMNQAMQERPILREFDRQSHEDMVDSFRTLDRSLIEHNRLRVVASHWKSVPRNSAIGEVGFIRLQMSRQRGHRSIRMAMREAPSAIQAIKPVFMMSPLSVAMYLPPEGPIFDVAIFDEASQIKPEDALGSVIRASQIIVVGDTKQMPPTSFFDRITGSDEFDEDESDDIEAHDIAEQESILAFASFRIPEGSPCRRDLRWHYRSRHESLITTSNRLFYRDRLVIFPHPSNSDGEMGLILRHLPDTVYGRGGARKNEREAKEVAKTALDHVLKFPNQSLGIVAFSKAQQEAIEDELDLLRKHEPSLREFDEQHGLDRLFVKNLESVQGDERDVIYISIGYGRDRNGFLGMNFGPLSAQGGERRLNVLITRARLRIVVFSNFKAEDMRMGESRSEGVKALHTFLAFAESGHLDVIPTTLKLEPSYFEELVFEQLRNKGYEIDKQVGSEGFYIDLAVRHPEFPGRYAIGIECDGAMYHSARSARDRDRLRQQVLEDRGWRIHRIWSTDWWRHSKRELERCCNAIDNAIGLTTLTTISTEGMTSHDSHEKDRVNWHDISNELVIPVADDQHSPSPYLEAKLIWPDRYQISELSSQQVAHFVKQVVEVEAPVHIDEITSRIREAAGKGRAGRLIREQIVQAIDIAKRKGFIELRGEFAYIPNQVTFAVRSRSGFLQQSKKIHLIAPEEIEQAAVIILQESLAVDQGQIARPVGNLLGFDCVSTEIENHINTVIRNAVAQGRLKEVMGKLELPE